MTAAPEAGPLTPAAVDAVVARRGDHQLVVARRASVPLVQLRALLPAPGGAHARLAAGCLLRRPGVREQLDRVGATAQSAGRPDGLLVSACAEPGQAQDALAFLLELLASPEAPAPDVLASEAARLAAADAVAARDPGDATRRAALAAAFGAASPYAEQLAEDLTAVTPADVQRWQEQAGPALVVVCGDLDLQAEWGDPGFAAGPERVELSAASRPVRWQVRDRPGSAQTTLRAVAAFPRPGSSERAAGEVVQRLLGGGKGSRLVRELRERRGFGYHPGTSVVDLAGASYLLLEVDVATEVTDQAVRVVDEVLDSMSADRPDDDELEFGRRSVAGDLARALDAQGSMADLLLAHAVAGVRPEAVGVLARDVAQTSADSIAGFGARLAQGLHGAAAADVSAVRDQQLPATWGRTA